MNKKNIKFIFISQVLFFGLFFGSANFVFAETRLYFEGISKSVSPNSEVDIKIFLSANRLANALTLEVAYPKDKLDFIGFNNASSIVDLWQFQPKVLTNGNIGFSGGMIRGWVGDKGLIGTLSFKVLNDGEAKISFEKREIYLADGKATKVVPNNNNFNLSIDKASEKMFVEKFKPDDITPPEVSFSVIKNPSDNVSLIIFNSSDKESGIKDTKMRFKKWWSFGEWIVVESPVVYPGGAWQIELRITNNSMGSKNEIISDTGLLVARIIYTLFPLFLLVYMVREVYNKKKHARQTI